MIELIYNLPMNWGILFIGLKNDWLTTQDVSKIANMYSSNLKCCGNFLTDLYVNEDDKNVILSLIKDNFELDEQNAIKYWQLFFLNKIEQSKMPINEKLREIEIQWARFDYPEEWRGFIYYLPNEKVNTNDGIYNIFMSYINIEKKKLKKCLY